MTISITGVNVNNDLGVSGNVGIGVAPSATYKVNVSGSLNATSVLVNGTAISGSQWTTGTPATNIYYNSGNVGIGTTNPTNKLDVLGNVEKQSKRIKKLEELLNIIDDDEVDNDADEPYTRINCEDEVDIDTIEPSEPVGV